jgi:hypothetical protein
MLKESSVKYITYWKESIRRIQLSSCPPYDGYYFVHHINPAVVAMQTYSAGGDGARASTVFSDIATFIAFFDQMHIH